MIRDIPPSVRAIFINALISPCSSVSLHYFILEKERCYLVFWKGVAAVRIDSHSVNHDSKFRNTPSHNQRSDAQVLFQ